MCKFTLIAISTVFFMPCLFGMERIVFLGDSLTAGYRMDPELAYPQLVEKALKDGGMDVSVVNAGVSGDTSAGGLRRINWILQQDIDVLFIALGVNDALRGQPPESVRRNLQGIINKAREMHPDIRIVLAGMLAPPNMGQGYRDAFDRIYPELAEAESVELMPFLLEDVAGNPELNLADGIHPNSEGQKIIAQNVFEILN